MRIIAGKHRGRKLCAVTGENVRPTADRAKESFFQILSPRIAGARVLDLFCGSGALGIECLSRGAGEAVFNDCSKESLQLLRKNLALVKESGKIYCLDFCALLKSAEGPFDLVFADPPYACDYLSEILHLIGERKLLSPNGLVIYESDKIETGAENWERADMRRYGKTYLSFWRQL